MTCLSYPEDPYQKHLDKRPVLKDDLDSFQRKTGFSVLATDPLGKQTAWAHTFMNDTTNQLDKKNNLSVHIRVPFARATGISW